MKNISTRGRTFTGIVVSNKMTKTVTVEWTRRHYIPKYERYETRRTKVKAHDETEAQIGDVVIIKETRPLSKTKNFVIIKNLKNAGKNTEAALQEAESLDVDELESPVEEKKSTKASPKKTLTKVTTKTKAKTEGAQE